MEGILLEKFYYSNGSKRRKPEKYFSGDTKE